MNDNGHALRILIRPDAGVLKRAALAALTLRVVTLRVVAFLVVALLVPVSASLLAASPLAAKEKPPAARQAEKPPQTPPDKIRLLLARPVDATALPLLDAQAQGTFRAGNLDVAITPGTSDEETLLQIGRGLFDVGIVDFAALIRYRAQVDGKTDKGNKSEPSSVKAIAVIFNRSAHAIVARKSRGIASFKDLAGKKLGLTGDDSLNLQWPALARLSELNPSSVTIERISPAVREPLLSAGQIDAVTALTYRTPIDIKDRGVPADDLIVLKAADAGYPLYGDVIVVSPGFADGHADSLRRFLVAYQRGLSDAIRKPAPALDALRLSDKSARELELARWKAIVADNIAPHAPRDNGFGDASDERLQESIALVLDTKSPKLQARDLFNRSFLPPPNGAKVR